MKFAKITSCWLLFFALPYSLQAQTKGSRGVSEPLRSFVQGFYNWYVPRALSDNAGPASELALKYKSSVFEPQLARALREDSAAQAKSPGEIVGLDFDPFLNSQDPAERYEVGRIARKGERYRADIYGVFSGQKRKKPDVVAELLEKNGRWFFVNFHYPEDGDLLTVLRLLRESRQKASK